MSNWAGYYKGRCLRAMLKLRVEHEWTYIRIGELFGLSETRAHQLIERAHRLAHDLAEARQPEVRKPEPTDKPHQEEAMVREGEIAEFLNVKVATLRHWRATEQGPRWYKLGGAVRYKVGDIQTWLDSRRVQSTTEGEALQ